MLLTDYQGDIAVISLNRPPTNFFDRSLIAALADAYAAAADDGMRAIVLRSEGKHFCAGADFSGGKMADSRVEASAQLYREALRLFSAPLPVVAAVQGSAVGGGLGLACSADFRVGSSTSRLHANFSMLGFHQGFGISETLPEVVGMQTAMDLLYTSRRVTGEEAAQLGLVDRLAPVGDETRVACELAAEIARAAPLAVQAIRQTLRARLTQRVSEVLDRELSEQDRLWQTEDSREGIRANLAREVPSFCGR